jgi:hypothetical protein
MMTIDSTRTTFGPSDAANKGRVITNALIRAADWLGVTAAGLSGIIGLSQPTISRMRSTTYTVNEGTKAYELSSYFVRVYRSLFAIVSGDQVTARSWLTNYNIALRGIPLELMKTIRGINEVSTYLDARRAIV